MTVLAILRYWILEGYEKPGKSTSTKQADSGAMMSAREERLPKSTVPNKRIGLMMCCTR